MTWDLLKLASSQALRATRSVYAAYCEFDHDKTESVSFSGAAIELVGDGVDFPLSLEMDTCTFNSTFFFILFGFFLTLKIKDNVGIHGGAVYVDALTSPFPFSFVVNASVFDGNFADNGGAVGISHPNPNMIFTDTVFKRNEARFLVQEPKSGFGGAIFITGLRTHPTKKSAQFTRCSFESNYALTAGAIWMDFFGGDYTGSTFKNNSVPVLNFEDASECQADNCEYCGGNLCTESKRSRHFSSFLGFI